MIFRNAFNLFIDNFKLNYKYLLYKIIVVLLTVGLSAALIVPNISFIFSSAELSTLVELFKDFFGAIAKGDTEFLAGFSERLTAAVADMGTLLQSKTSNIVFTAVSAVVSLLVSKFLGGMGNFTLGSLLDDRLSSYANTSFSGAFIKNLGKSSLWQLFYVPVTFVYDVLVILLCYAFFLLMLAVFQVGVIATLAALMLSVTLFVGSQAIKLTFANSMVPAIVTDRQKMGKAIKKGFRASLDGFGKMFSTYLVTCYLIMGLNILAALVTFGSALLITIPSSYLLLVCIQFVSYYTSEKKKYFVAADKIVVPEETRKDENFYDNISIN